MLDGKESDKETIKKADAIIRESEKLRDSNASSTAEE